MSGGKKILSENTASEPSSLRSRMTVGSAWMVAVNLFRRSIGVISTIILARLLPPEDFGLVAMGTVLIGFLQAFTEFGFDAAIIQRQNVTRDHYDTAWTLKVITGAVSTGILIALAWPAASFYGDSRVTPIIVVLATSVFLKSLENIGVVNFRKKFEFHKEFLFFSSIKLSAFVVTLSIALATRSYWALVIGTITSRVSGLILSFRMESFRPRFSFGATKDLFAFSIWMFLNNLLVYLRNRGADFILGRTLGARSVGLFNVSYEIATLPSNEVIAPINRAIYTGYSAVSGEIFRFRTAFLTVFAIVTLLAVPTGVGIAAVSDLAIPVLLGANWLDAVPVVHTLALIGVLTAMTSNPATAVMALGKPRIPALITGFSVLILIPLVVILSNRYGMTGVIYAYLIANSFSFIVYFFLPTMVFGVRVRDLIRAVYRPAISAGLMYASVTWYKHELLAGEQGLPALLISILFGAVVFIGANLLFWWLAGRPEGAESWMIRGVSSKTPLKWLGRKLLRSN